MITVDQIHNLVVGDVVEIFDSIPNIDGEFIITGISTQTTFNITSTINYDTTGILTYFGKVRTKLVNNLSVGDIGVELNWHNGNSIGTIDSRIGFFGFDIGDKCWTFIPEAQKVGKRYFGDKGTLCVGIINCLGINLGGSMNTGNNLISGSNFLITGGNINGVEITNSKGSFTEICINKLVCNLDINGNQLTNGILNGVEITNGKGSFTELCVNKLVCNLDIIGNQVLNGNYLNSKGSFTEICIEKLTCNLDINNYNLTNASTIQANTGLFTNLNVLKTFIINDVLPALKNSKYKIKIDSVIDTSVYREGLFRTIYSTKSGEKRPFVFCKSGDEFEDMDSFIACPVENSQIFEWENGSAGSSEIGGGNKKPIKRKASVKNEKASSKKGKESVEEESSQVGSSIDLNKQDYAELKKFIRDEFNYSPSSLSSILLDSSKNCIIVALVDKYCKFASREHKSNFQYLLFNSLGCKKKCHDVDCSRAINAEILFKDLPEKVKIILNRVLKLEDKDINLLDVATTECTRYIKENYDENISPLVYDKNLNLFKSEATNSSIVNLVGKCEKCIFEHQISTNGEYCIKCKICSSMFPTDTHIKIPKHTNPTFYQFIQNNTIIINNNYGAMKF
ncbi:hypothetical protein HK099_005353 [Clydaea vesicula]|uniref:Uncharacterized protein n=1 Tax=Clydaea vesicula TaxID=447962 RepID=A0AAD5TZD5_9FUNG|nr:hypothetical protein HK099_005353 [Clydaea vesicula]